jgi:hypothetical protein
LTKISKAGIVEFFGCDFSQAKVPYKSNFNPEQQSNTQNQTAGRKLY